MSVNILIDQIADALRAKIFREKEPTLEKTGAQLSPHKPNIKAEATNSVTDNPLGIASKIDHTLLKSDATQEDIRKICAEAREYNFATVCVNSSFIPLAASLLHGSHTKPITVVGFPLGAMASAAKAFEAREAIVAGAQEIDMVIHLGALKSGDYAKVLEDIQAVVQASRPLPVSNFRDL